MTAKALTGKLLMRSGLSRFFTIQTAHGFKLRFHNASLAESFWQNPARRGVDINFIKSELKPEDTYIDVGANIGTTIIPAALAGADCIAFEAHPRVFGYLQENIALNLLNANIAAHNVALSDRGGLCNISDTRDDDTNAIAHTGIPVPMARLDSFTGDIESIALLKIDVEGHEKMVLKGAAETLRKTRTIYVEFNPEACKAQGYHVEDLKFILEQAGFSLWRMNHGTIEKLKEIPGPMDAPAGINVVGRK